MADVTKNGPVRAAGAVVWRPAPSGPEVALVHRPRYDDWSFPKGKCRSGEHVLAAAIREVREETGLRVELGRPLTPLVYEVGDRVKHVSYWAARCVESGDFVPNNEVDEVLWVPAASARERLTYMRDVALVDELASGPVRTAPLIMLRHAEAGPRSALGGDRAMVADLDRPLDARGAAEAAILTNLLASYGRCRVLSSAAERCLATVRPYAAAVGVPVEVEPAFTVDPDAASDAGLLLAGAGQAARGRPGELARHESLAEQGVRRVASLAASGAPALICAHRENLPVLMDAAFGALGASPPDAEPLEKAEFWVLHSAGGVLVSAERHSPWE